MLCFRLYRSNINNYNANACYDDGSCTYNYGCTDPTAANYDPLATMDDGSCIYCNINDSVVFNYTGSIQTYTVPAGVTSVTIEAYGAQGGNGGGLGAEISGTFNVIPNQVLNILVGGEGGTRTNNLGVGGGGGGSFIWDQSNNYLLLQEEVEVVLVILKVVILELDLQILSN